MRFYKIALGVSAALLTVVTVILVFTSNRAGEMSLSYENSLKASLQESVSGMRDIENDLARLMVTTSENAQMNTLSALAIKGNACSRELSRLPIIATGVQNTLKFINQLTSFSATAIKNYFVYGEMPQNLDAQTKSFFETCKSVNAQLAIVEAQVLTGETSLLEVGNLDFSSSGILGSINDDVVEYPSVIFDGPFSDGQEESTPETDRKEISIEEARKHLSDMGLDLEYEAEINGTVPAYLFKKGTLSAQITKKGGLLLMLVDARTPNRSELTLSEAEKKATEFLEKAGYTSFKTVWREYYSNMAVYNFAPVLDETVVYPDLIKVEIALDDGSVSGFEGKNYVMNSFERALPDPQISLSDARLKLKEGFSVEREGLCIIPKDNREYLCYEFFGTFSGMQFFIYISAETGEEKACFRLIKTEAGQMVS